MSEKKAVRIKLFKDNSRYKGDLFVSVNGVNYKIRRGVEVEVPPETPFTLTNRSPLYRLLSLNSRILTFFLSIFHPFCPLSQGHCLLRLAWFRSSSRACPVCQGLPYQGSWREAPERLYGRTA